MRSEQKERLRGTLERLSFRSRFSRPLSLGVASLPEHDSTPTPEAAKPPLLRYLWAAPNTLLGAGLALIAAAGGGTVRAVAGTLEAEGPWLAWLLRRLTLPAAGVEALTLGHVVLGRDRYCLERCRRHERVHVEQYERWGPLFLPAYTASSLWQLACGRDPYRDNRFEHQAFAIAPVDPQRPTSPPSISGSES